jgi:hypothetical protein
MVAKSCPRDEAECVERIMTACQRLGLAEKAEYVYDRGGTEVTGPTIDLMQVIATIWGNLDFGFRELSYGNGESTVECYAWDLQTNAKEVRVVTVPHKRYSRERGLTALIDPRDIYEMVANNAQRRVRACLEAVIPPDIVEQAVAECHSTLKAKAQVNEESIAKLLDAFAQFNVGRDQIQKRLGRRLESMQPAQLVRMRAIWKSLTDGMSQAEDWFEMQPAAAEDQPKTATEAVKQALKAGKKQPEETAESTAPVATEQPDREKVTDNKPVSEPPAETKTRRKAAAESKAESKPAAETKPVAPAKPAVDPIKKKIDDVVAYIRARWEDECGEFDLEALARAALTQKNPRAFVDGIIGKLEDTWENYQVSQEGGQDSESAAEGAGESADDGNQDKDWPDYVRDPLARPASMEDDPGLDLEKKLLTFRKSKDIKKFLADEVSGQKHLQMNEIAYLEDVGKRRSWYIDRGQNPPKEFEGPGSE